MRTTVISVWVASALTVAASISGQAVTTPTVWGTIEGRVVDVKNGHPLAYTNVIIIGTTRGAMALTDGKYLIPCVPPGTYTVKAMMMGYKAFEKWKVVVRAGETTTVDFSLTRTIVAKTQEIKVEASKPMIEATESKTVHVVSSQQLVEMPVDDVLESVALGAGIVTQGDDMHVRGGRGESLPGLATDSRPATGENRGRRDLDEKETYPRQFQPTMVYNKQPLRRCVGPMQTETYDRIVENGMRDAVDHPFSTFSIDVDPASYANMRRFLAAGRMPPPDAVRIEEFINYFDYDYPEPEGEDPFSITAEVAGCPWNADHKLVHIGLQGRHVPLDKLPPSNLVFLIDVSGSMTPPNKLPLLQRAFRLLVDNLRDNDRVAIVVYAGSAGLVLPSTPGSDKETIRDAIEQLYAGGSTAGAAGIRLAYDTAREHFITGGNNRVILATDGDFNVGVSSTGNLTRLIEEERESGVFLSVLGFGEGNLMDSRMEQLADKGNGNYSYIDNLSEARKVLVSQMAGTLFTIAKDVKIQLEFNPARVQSYRLIGYENRVLKKEDFDDDRKDAGELGSGHSVTALYEIVPAPKRQVAYETRYTYIQIVVASSAIESSELLTVRFRYKAPDADESLLILRTVDDADRAFDQATDNLRLAAAVAEFGMMLRSSEYLGDATFSTAIAIAESIHRDDPDGARAELIELMKTSRRIAGR
jgi:Ca-activated chloride channel family protein